VYLDPDDALTAAALPDEKTIILSSGLAADRGRGSTDLNEDGQRDFTSFNFTLNIPEGAKTLVFGARFNTSESDRAGGGKNERATYQFSWTPCNVIGCSTAPLDLISVAEVPDADNPFVRRYIRVDGWETIELNFQVSDRDDGLYDSALIIKDMYFSELEMPGTSRVLERLPSEDVKLSVGSYRFQKNLMHVPGKGVPFDFTVYYNARQTWTSTFARKWSHSYAWSLQELESGVVHIRGGDGGSLYFSPNGENINATDASSFLTSWKGGSRRQRVSFGGWYGACRSCRRRAPQDMKLYFIYTPPEHPDGTIHPTKAEADAAEHHH